MSPKVASHTGSRHTAAIDPGRRDDTRALRIAFDFLVGEIQRLEGRSRDVLLGFLRASPLRSALYPDASAFDADVTHPRIRTASRRVKKVEHYLETHWRETVTVARLCAATGITPRTLFQMFRAERGYTPMWFLKRIRLRHARAALSNPAGGVSVRQVARDCGFANLGHFARSYYLAFGERPLTTLYRAKRTAGRSAAPPDI